MECLNNLAALIVSYRHRLKYPLPGDTYNHLSEIIDALEYSREAIFTSLIKSST